MEPYKDRLVYIMLKSVKEMLLLTLFSWITGLFLLIIRII
jgi:hypothetical protein